MATTDRDALAVAVLALHEALDGWAAGVVAAADAHPDDPDRAVEQPGLGLAEEVFDTAFDGFHEAASAVLGITDEDDDAEPRPDDADAVGVQLYATVVGDGVGEPVVLVDQAGEQVIAALEAAGFEVPEWSVSIVPVQVFDDDDTEDDS